MPSFVWVGGMRMSVSTTSGEVSATDSRSEARSVATATTSMSSTSVSKEVTPCRTR